MRISSPPTMNSCHYGIDTPTRRELIASNHSVEEIREFIGADSLGYLSAEGMLEAFGRPQQAACTACFTGHLSGRDRGRGARKRERPRSLPDASGVVTASPVRDDLRLPRSDADRRDGRAGPPDSLLVVRDGRIVSVGAATPEALAALPAGTRGRRRVGQVDRARVHRRARSRGVRRRTSKRCSAGASPRCGSWPRTSARPEARRAVALSRLPLSRRLSRGAHLHGEGRLVGPGGAAGREPQPLPFDRRPTRRGSRCARPRRSAPPRSS